MPSNMKRSVVIGGHKTSVSLEDCFWQALMAEAKSSGRTINSLVSEIDDGGRHRNLSSQLRVYLFNKATNGSPRI